MQRWRVTLVVAGASEGHAADPDRVASLLMATLAHLEPVLADAGGRPSVVVVVTEESPATAELYVSRVLLSAGLGDAAQIGEVVRAPEG